MKLSDHNGENKAINTLCRFWGNPNGKESEGQEKERASDFPGMRSLTSPIQG